MTWQPVDVIDGQTEAAQSGNGPHAAAAGRRIPALMKAEGAIPVEVPPVAGGKRQALVRIALEASARSVDQIETAEAYSPSPALGSPLPPLRIRYDAPQVGAASKHNCVRRSRSEVERSCPGNRRHRTTTRSHRPRRCSAAAAMYAVRDELRMVFGPLRHGIQACTCCSIRVLYCGQLRRVCLGASAVRITGLQRIVHEVLDGHASAYQQSAADRYGQAFGMPVSV